MNPLTLVKRIQKINSTEANLGISDEASWHAKYKDSAYVFVGGVPFQLTEGDLLAVFSQYGEVVDVNLVRDKGTGKSKGFAFLAYEDQRSTVLAVDNLNGAKLLGRVVRVDHVGKYKKKQEEEDEDEANRKREARGVCYAFQRGECNRGDGCRFSHDPERNANTGVQDRRRNSRWEHDMQDPPPHRTTTTTTTNLSSSQHPTSERSRETKRSPTSFPFHNNGLSSRLRSDQDVDDGRTTTQNQDHGGHPTHTDNSHKETRYNDNTDRDRQTRERRSSRSEAEADRLDDKRRRTYEKRPKRDHDSSSDYQHRWETERERGRR